MSRIIHYTLNPDKGFPITADNMEVLQRELQDAIRGIRGMAGNNSILEGCASTGPSTYDDGIVVWNDELFYFEGGAFGTYVVVNEVETELIHCDENSYPAYKVRTLQFAGSVGAGDTYFNATDTDGFGVLTRVPTLISISNSLVTLQTNIDTVETDLTNLINTEITNLQNQINTINTSVGAIDGEIGDVKYVRNISNFGADGLGLTGTNREGWAMIMPLANQPNEEWKTALGYTGTYNDIEGRGIVMAGVTYSVLQEFGADSVQLTADQTATKGHTHTASVTGTVGSTTSTLRTDSTAGGDDSFLDRGGANGGNDIGTDSNQSNPHTHTWSGDVTIDPTVDADADQAHENRQPSIALHLIVKYA